MTHLTFKVGVSLVHSPEYTFSLCICYRVSLGERGNHVYVIQTIGLTMLSLDWLK